MPRATSSVTSRLSQLQTGMKPDECWLVANPYHIEYLTGFKALVPAEREALLLLDKQRAWLCHAPFSPTPTTPGLTLKPGCGPAHLIKHLEEWHHPEPTTTRSQLTAAAWHWHLDETQLTMLEGRNIQAVLNEYPHTLSAWVSTPLWRLRQRKQPAELKAISGACAITTQVVSSIISQLEPGQTEQQLQKQIDSAFVAAGADGTAFPTIVAFGDHAALPHHQPTSTPLQPEMAVLIDCGARLSGYCSDMTRSLWFGDRPPADWQTAQAAVHQAYDAAMTILKTHARSSEPPTARQVDQAARQSLTDAGLGPQFIHTTGHSLGLEIHEPPSVGASDPTPLAPTMVLTIEPGVYFPDHWGYRYENTVLLTDHGVTELTTAMLQ